MASFKPNGPGCGDASCPRCTTGPCAQICTTVDPCAGHPAGSSVTLVQGATTTGPTNTDATGRLCMPATSGAYTITVSRSRFDTVTVSGTAKCPPPPTPVTYGPLYPSTTTSDATVGSVAWTNPSNADASDGVFATSTSTGSTPTQYLKALNFGFAVTADGTEALTGIKLEVGCKASAAATDSSVKLVVGGTIQATEKATGAALSTGGTAILTYGSNSDLWGTSGLLPTDVNGSTFGVVWSATSPGSGGGGSTNTGAVYPSTTADDNTGSFGSVSWVGVTNAEASDGVFATASIGVGNPSHLIKSSGHGFSVPGTATILGIKVEVGAKASGNSHDFKCFLVKGGTVQTGGTNQAANTALTTTLTNYTYGSSSDLWGGSWTPSDVNASNFGAAWSATSPAFPNNTVSVDYIRITVYYSTPGNTTISVDYMRLTVYTTRMTYEVRVNLVPSAGYGCLKSIGTRVVPVCPDPFPTTLYVTDSFFGDTTACTYVAPGPLPTVTQYWQGTRIRAGKVMYYQLYLTSGPTGAGSITSYGYILIDQNFQAPRASGAQARVTQDLAHCATPLAITFPPAAGAADSPYAGASTTYTWSE